MQFSDPTQEGSFRLVVNVIPSDGRKAIAVTANSETAASEVNESRGGRFWQWGGYYSNKESQAQAFFLHDTVYTSHPKGHTCIAVEKQTHKCQLTSHRKYSSQTSTKYTLWIGEFLPSSLFCFRNLDICSGSQFSWVLLSRFHLMTCQSVVKFTGVIFYSNCHYRPSQRIVSPPVGYSSENSTNKGWKFHRGKNSFVMSVDNPFPRLSPLPKEYHATFVCQHEPWAKSHLKTTRQAWGCTLTICQG